MLWAALVFLAGHVGSATALPGYAPVCAGTSTCCAGYSLTTSQYYTPDRQCVLCPAGSYCVNSGRYACASGRFSLPGSTACSVYTVCGTDQYQAAAPSPSSDTVCTPCVTGCAPGQYLQGLPCTGLPRAPGDLPACLGCVPSCAAGYFLNFQCAGHDTVSNLCLKCGTPACASGQFRSACTLTADSVCQACASCGPGRYNQGCEGGSSGTCVACTTSCGPGYSLTQGCTALSDTVCSHATCDIGTSCAPLYCQYGAQPLANNLKWGRSDGGAWLNMRATTTGTCQKCPPGWTVADDGGSCQSCEDGWSCDVLGVRQVEVECDVGKFPRKDPMSEKDVSCYPCGVDIDAAERTLHAVITRGGVYVPSATDTEPDAWCTTYTQCDVGFVLNVSTGSQACVPCSPAAAGMQHASRGLTNNDIYSCIQTPAIPSLSSNTQGSFGPYSTQCVHAHTTQAGAALTADQCVQCPLAPPTAKGLTAPGSTSCALECTPPWVLVGTECISHVFTSLPASPQGYYVESLTASGASWAAQSLPWNTAGNTAAVGLAPPQLHALPPRQNPSPPSQWSPPVWVDDAGAWAATPYNLYDLRNGAMASWLQGQAGPEAYCKSTEGITTTQDMPLVAEVCTSIQEFRIYLVHQGADGYLYVFLERTYGSNNRYVLWQVSLTFAQHVRIRWRLPGQVCSATSSLLAPYTPASPQGTTYVYLAFCGSAMVSFVTTSDGPMDCPAVQVGQSASHNLCSQTRVLAGADVAGNKDGLRDDARFGADLSIATGRDPTRVFVADQNNCRLAEIWIDSPGSWLTTVGTVSASCFAEGAIPNPRLLTSVLNGAFLLFLTNNGVMQMDTVFRDVVDVVGAADLRMEPQWLGADATSVRLWSGTHVQVVVALQTPCPPRYVSLPGGSCTPCGASQYAEANLCKECTPLRQADCDRTHPGEGYEAFLCNETMDSQCAPCDIPTPASPFRYTAACGTQLIGPCPVGWYAAHDGDDCTACPDATWGTTRQAGATSLGDCVCSMGGTLQPGQQECLIASPYKGGVPDWPGPPPQPWLNGQGCSNQLTGGDTKCTVECPPYDDTGCTECGATGHYLEQVSPRVCLRCPEGTQGRNGLFCVPCEGVRVSDPLRESCICKPPAVFSPPGNCSCPSGHALSVPASCAPCAAGYARDGPVMLSDALDSPSDWLACLECPPGTTSPPGAARCDPCPFGQFREAGQPSCQPCQAAASYATDAADGGSCVACVPARADCPTGQRTVLCPVDQGMFDCEPCPPLTPPQTWVPANSDCYWTCPGTHYIGPDGCVPCSPVAACAPGHLFTPCTPYADADCYETCANSSMPLEHAEYTAGCAWACSAGYRPVESTFTGWTEHACVPAP